MITLASKMRCQPEGKFVREVSPSSLSCASVFCLKSIVSFHIVAPDGNLWSHSVIRARTQAAIGSRMEGIMMRSFSLVSHTQTPTTSREAAVCVCVCFAGAEGL